MGFVIRDKTNNLFVRRSGTLYSFVTLNLATIYTSKKRALHVIKKGSRFTLHQKCYEVLEVEVLLKSHYDHLKNSKHD